MPPREARPWAAGRPDGIGYGGGKQCPYRLARARFQQAIQIASAQTGTRGVVHQHPVLRLRTRLQRDEAVVHRARAVGAARDQRKPAGMWPRSCSLPPSSAARTTLPPRQRVSAVKSCRATSITVRPASNACCLRLPKRRPEPAAGITNQYALTHEPQRRAARVGRACRTAARRREPLEPRTAAPPDRRSHCRRSCRGRCALVPRALRSPA